MRNVTKDERKNWIINIENTSSTISSQVGAAVADSVFQRYGAHSVEDLNPCDLPDVFSELYAIEADLR
jgi:threonine/homoserine efflux transporter RhtA